MDSNYQDAGSGGCWQIQYTLWMSHESSACSWTESGQAPARERASGHWLLRRQRWSSRFITLLKPLWLLQRHWAVTCSGFFTLVLQCLRHGQYVNRLETLGSAWSWQDKGTRRAAQVALVQQSWAQAGTSGRLLKVCSSDLSVGACSGQIPPQLLRDVLVLMTAAARTSDGCSCGFL